MHKTYTDFVYGTLQKEQVGNPIYTKEIADFVGDAYSLNQKEAAAATAVAMKRIMERALIPALRFYQKGIYYMTASTPFGEVGIDKEKLIAKKYLLPDMVTKPALPCCIRWD